MLMELDEVGRSTAGRTPSLSGVTGSSATKRIAGGGEVPPDREEITGDCDSAHTVRTGGFREVQCHF